jgi:hypothetical protein
MNRPETQNEKQKARMSWPQKIADVIRSAKLDRDIDEEIASHMSMRRLRTKNTSSQPFTL